MKDITLQQIGNYSDKNKVKKYYEIVKNNIENETSGVDANVFNYLKKTLPNNLNEKIIIDLGCGDGRWSKYLNSLGTKQIYAVDNSEEMIKKATQNLRNLKNKKIICADIQKLPFQNNSIDIGLSTFSLMYFENLETVINEIGRVLKSNGLLYITTNIINISDTNFLQKLRGKSIPVDLGFNQKIRLENLVQPLIQYKNAFNKAEFAIELEKYFKPEGFEIANDYKYKNKIHLEKVLFVVRKL